MRIGIDLGGTKIAAIALDDTGGVLSRRRVDTPKGDYQATIDAIARLVSDIEADCGGTGTVGVGIPGSPSSHTGLVKNANSVWLIGKPFDCDLSAALGRPVRIANDSNCFALSEATDGGAAAARIVFGVILGTGVGGGLVVSGDVLAGANAIAGEWGHNPLPWPTDEERPGPDCYCGRRGCIETFLSGPAMAAAHFARTGQRRDAREIAAHDLEGDADAASTLAIYEHRLARALATVVNIVDPDCIVLGGGLSNIARLYDNVPKLWRDYVFSDRVDTRLVRPKHGDSSGERGAAWLWPPRA